MFLMSHPPASYTLFPYTTLFRSWAGLITGFTNPTAVNSFARTNFPAGWTSCTPALGASPAPTARDPTGFNITHTGQARTVVDCDTWTIDENKLILNTTINL